MITSLEMELLRDAEIQRAKLKAALDRKAGDRAVAAALGDTAQAFCSAFTAIWRRLQGDK